MRRRFFVLDFEWWFLTMWFATGLHFLGDRFLLSEGPSAHLPGSYFARILSMYAVLGAIDFFSYVAILTKKKVWVYSLPGTIRHGALALFFAAHYLTIISPGHPLPPLRASGWSEVIDVIDGAHFIGLLVLMVEAMGMLLNSCWTGHRCSFALLPGDSRTGAKRFLFVSPEAFLSVSCRSGMREADLKALGIEEDESLRDSLSEANLLALGAKRAVSVSR
jgi:hypothetical protein